MSGQIDCGAYGESEIPFARATKNENLKQINSISETNGSFDSCNSYRRLGPSRSDI